MCPAKPACRKYLSGRPAVFAASLDWPMIATEAGFSKCCASLERSSTLPWRGRVGEHAAEAEYEPGWGEFFGTKLTPTRRASLVDLPPPGGGKEKAHSAASARTPR